MRKFIISDIHGLGNIYYSVMGYLDNISKTEEIVLFINGDLIDRGPDSAEILIDVINRTRKGPFKIEYLGGNHELLMSDCFEARKKKLFNAPNLWFYNGGRVTDEGLDDVLDCNDRAILEVADFVSNLKIYHKFEETMGSKPIVLVHACCPIKVEDECPLVVKDKVESVYFYTWAREEDPDLPFRCRIGSPNYFAIVGHTPNNSKYGFLYNEKENYLNIDGGCSFYASGLFQYDRAPLVEVFNERLKILTFNNNGEIIFGNNFINGEVTPILDSELSKDRELLNKDFKPKQLVKRIDGSIGYEV